MMKLFLKPTIAFAIGLGLACSAYGQEANRGSDQKIDQLRASIAALQAELAQLRSRQAADSGPSLDLDLGPRSPEIAPGVLPQSLPTTALAPSSDGSGASVPFEVSPAQPSNSIILPSTQDGGVELLAPSGMLDPAINVDPRWQPGPVAVDPFGLPANRMPLPNRVTGIYSPYSDCPSGICPYQLRSMTIQPAWPARDVLLRPPVDLNYDYLYRRSGFSIGPYRPPYSDYQRP